MFVVYFKFIDNIDIFFEDLLSLRLRSFISKSFTLIGIGFTLDSVRLVEMNSGLSLIQVAKILTHHVLQLYCHVHFTVDVYKVAPTQVG